MFRRLCVLILAASPPLALAASKEIQELQRDVALLQQQVRDLQRSQDEKFASLMTLSQQALSAANDASKAVAVIQSGFQQNLRAQEDKVVAPVVGLGARMNEISSDVRTVQQAVADLTTLMTKLQAQMTDLTNAVKVMQAPAPPPPGGGTGTGPGPGTAPETPSISSTDLYNNARRDQTGGKFDLALQEYSDYLKWYGNTEYAPNAQYYIATIHASQGDLETAVKEFDLVLEKYPENNKTPDALYSKGTALMRLSRRTQAADEFKELIRRYPNNPLARQARDQLSSMGINPPRAAAPKGGTTRRKK